MPKIVPENVPPSLNKPFFFYGWHNLATRYVCIGRAFPNSRQDLETRFSIGGVDPSADTRPGPRATVEFTPG